MAGFREQNKKNMIITIIIVIVVVSIAAGLFLFFTLYDWSGGNRSENPSSTVSSTVSSGQASSTATPANFKQPADPLLVLVNADHKMPDGTDSDIVEQYGVRLDRRALNAYGELHAAASKAGINLWVSSGYRDPKLQGELHQQEIDDNLKKGKSESEAIEAANKAVQKSGYSEHNTGLAIDFNNVNTDFANTKAYTWLMQNAADYGFILRYTKDKENITGIMYEPWHFRYVGVENAKKINELNMCLEEYVDYLNAQQS